MSAEGKTSGPYGQLQVRPFRCNESAHPLTDIGALATELQSHLLQVGLSCCDRDGSTSGSRTCESDLVDSWVSRKNRTSL